MFKFSTFYKKKPGVDTKVFREWMLKYAKQFSQDHVLTGYRVNFVNDFSTLNIDPMQVGYDATSEQWLNSETEVELFHSRLTKEEVMEIERMYLNRTTFLTEEHVIINEPTVPPNFKLVVLLQRRSDMGAQEWREWWFKHAQLTAQMPGLRAYRINFITKAKKSELEELSINFDGTAQLWFDSLAGMESGFGSPIGKKASVDSDNHCGKRARFLTEEYRIV